MVDDSTAKILPSPTRRLLHFNTQRARPSTEERRPQTTSTVTGAVPHGDLQHSESYNAPVNYENLNEVAIPEPVQERHRERRQIGTRRATDRNESPNWERIEESPNPGPKWPLRNQSLPTNGSPSQRQAAVRQQPVPRRHMNTYLAPRQFQNLDEIAAPMPIASPSEHDLFHQRSLEEEREDERMRQLSQIKSGRAITAGEAARKASRQTLRSHASSSLNFDIPRPPPPPRASASTLHLSSIASPDNGEEGEEEEVESEDSLEAQLEAARRSGRDSLASPQSRRRRSRKMDSERVSKFATQLYTVSYLIFFSIWGTLARLGIQWLVFYPGAPTTIPVLWANFAGSFVFGFLAEDRRLFRDEWGEPHNSSFEKREVKNLHADEQGGGDLERGGGDDLERIKTSPSVIRNHTKVKKTIPLYIGLTTGFCGCLTSFSSFMRDVFLALSNDLGSPINHPYPVDSSSSTPPPSTGTTVYRNGGFSFEALLAILILNICLSLAALKAGAHIAIFLDRYTPTIPFRLLRKFVDRLIVFLAFGCWLGAVILSAIPPDRQGGPASSGSSTNETWRGQALFACVFAPLGCLLRFYASLKLNGISPSFPLGTFAVNIFGTAILGMAYDLQHSFIGTMISGGLVSCQVLQGLMDGLCGSLTTVSTFVAELNGLRRGHAYFYGLASCLSGLGVLIVIMGSVRWGVGWSDNVCV